MHVTYRLRIALGLTLLALAGFARADDAVATFKTVQGEVVVERGAQKLRADVGMTLLRTDVVGTGADASAGLGFADGTLFSLGANSRLTIDRFVFDRASEKGEFESTLSKGRMVVVSGRIAKSQIDAMKVRTPTSLLGVRGTEFVVEAGP